MIAWTALAASLCLATGPALEAPAPDRDAVVAAVIDAWARMWNAYDLAAVDRVFVADDRVTYFSSEREGLIRGIEALRDHHVRFGFVPGGKSQPNRLWLEERATVWHGDVALVLAGWRFRRGPDGRVQGGPVSFVLVPAAGGYRIAHAHFANE